MYLIDLTCSRCGFNKTIELELDKNGVYSIANLFCPKCLYKLDRELQEMVDPAEETCVPVLELKETEDTEDVEDTDESSAD